MRWGLGAKSVAGVAQKLSDRRKISRAGLVKCLHRMFLSVEIFDGMCSEPFLRVTNHRLGIVPVVTLKEKTKQSMQSISMDKSLEISYNLPKFK